VRSSLVFPLILGLTAHASSAQTTAPATEAEGYLPGAVGAELYYRVLGDAGDTVVVLHGGPGAGMGAIFPHLVPLADQFTVIFYDQRGGGRSTLPQDTALLDARYFVGDLEAVRRHFLLERLKLVAHSFGAVLAAAYAQEYPERIDRMVFFGATGPVRAEAAAAARAERTERAAADSATLRRLMRVMRSLLSGSAADPVAACREYERLSGQLSSPESGDVRWLGTTCDAPKEAVGYYYRYTAQITPSTFGDWDFSESLARLDAPLLVIHARQNLTGRKGLLAQRAWARAVQRGRLLVVPGAGIAERPELVIGAMETFLAGAWPDGARAPDEQ